MDGQQFADMLARNAREIDDFADNTFPHLAGDIAVKHFDENFDKQGFVDGGVTPWPEVERRKPQSPWYGYSPVNKGRFSATRAADPVLKDSNELRNATDYQVRGPGQVAIVNDKPYAEVHNNGGKAYIFGKTPFVMKQRQFVGDSKELDLKIVTMLTDELDRLLK